MLTSSVCDAVELDSKYGFYFRMFDINGDGSLSRDEVYNLLCSKQSDLAEKISKVQTILAALDYDGKGYITFEGYVNAANKHPGIKLYFPPNTFSLIYCLAPIYTTRDKSITAHYSAPLTPTFPTLSQLSLICTYHPRPS